MKKIKILHLYPEELNLYADSGNVLCLYSRLVRRGYSAQVSYAGIGDSIGDFDILFIGGGQDNEISLVSRDLKRKFASLSYAIENGKVILAICAGFQLLGDYYKTNDSKIIPLTGCLPFYTVASDNRMVSNTVFSTQFGTVVGFENHSGKTYLGKALSPLGNIIKGYGNNSEDGSEGLLYKNTFCTYAHGPVLPKNPAFADEIISRAVKKKLEPLDDTFENLCRSQLISRFAGNKYVT